MNNDQSIKSKLQGVFTFQEQEFLGDCISRMDSWLGSNAICESDKREIEALIENKEVGELRDRFYRELEFGTGGLRGLTGAGNNRMNPAVVQRATQGFANYILKQGQAALERGVAIAYDSRLRSAEFALEAARVLCANGIVCYLFDEVQTTPCLSFAVRHLKCIGGLCVTASHNPKQYHGYKVYWDDGAQIIAPQDSGILAEVFAISSWTDAKLISADEARQKKLLCKVPQEVEELYFEAVDRLQVHPATRAKNEFVIAYTPLHGTGARPASIALKRWGFENLFIVAAQEKPDGNFPTVVKPNPEEFHALEMVIDLAEKKQAQIALATDPDSDRLALVVRDAKLASSTFSEQSVGNYVLLNGNQTSALLLDYLLNGLKSQGQLKSEHKIVKTIVTSEMLQRICDKYHIELCNTLTGFKWIAGLVRQWETNSSTEGNHKFLFGTEESFGYMPGPYVRDKDGIGALCMATEMAAYYSSKGMTCAQRLVELFEEHGAWQEALISFDLEGEAGAKRISKIMQTFRSNPPAEFSGTQVSAMRDYQVSIETSFLNGSAGQTKALLLPKSNVLQFSLADGSVLSMRPSGTEPKLKVYFSVCTKEKGAIPDYETSHKKVLKLVSDLQTLMTAIH